MNAIAQPSNARSRRTRAMLLAATKAILEEEGFEALSMTAVAERAGVTRRTAYLHFPSRADLVSALFDYVATTAGLKESLQPVWQAPDSVTALQEWARHLARYHPRILPVARALDRVRRHDPEAAAYRQVIIRAQLDGCRRLATWLHEENQLAPPWTMDSATDMLWALISTDTIEGLLQDRHWTKEQLATHLIVLLESTFVRR